MLNFFHLKVEDVMWLSKTHKKKKLKAIKLPTYHNRESGEKEEEKKTEYRIHAEKCWRLCPNKNSYEAISNRKIKTKWNKMCW